MVIPWSRLMCTSRTILLPRLQLYSRSYSKTLPGVAANIRILNNKITNLIRDSKLDEARMLFDKSRQRNPVTWNSMLSGYVRRREIVKARQLFDEMPERDTNGDLRNAVGFFKKMPERDAASLSALVSGLIQNGELDEAGKILLETSCENDERLDMVHACNTLIAGYGRKGRIEDARHLFDEIPYHRRNVVSWNTMIMCYVKARDVLSARVLFDQMMERDTCSWNTMINGYIEISDMEEASYLFKEMPNPDVYTWNSLISGFSQMGKVGIAREFFQRAPQRNRVSWNSIIAAYEKNKEYKVAIELFTKMQSEGEKPDRHTLSSLMSVCAENAYIHLGIQIHQQLIKIVTPDVPLNNSLITMYARCGAITEARVIFEEMKFRKDVISWNAMIGGYASHGYATKALELFGSMKKLSIQPTYITFISVLNACANAGLAEEGRMHFKSMINEFGIKPRVEHFASLVDTMGRNGQLEEAIDLIKGMPVKPDKAVWGALLGACKVHNNIKLAQVAAEALIRLEPESSTPYVLLHNMYADVGQWDDATEIRMLMEKHNIRKAAGYSLVDSSSR
ncbi:Pentatricopeptide repeat-containing protein [Cynara cardunculus var. scolymus]|uniref:Pentatricopeptide repeat-containing protein n=1 Tax=Cynara cardunculus var. scolymus TaxID=59895 RepID=A0A118K5T4_CYNCS|nr:Pentatricopeptide repeat-containing protein [Cynara cardunculus var. scolymus]